MKIKQNKPDFKPITVILETREEASAFLAIIDDTHHKNNSTRWNLVRKISNAFTNLEVVI